MRPTRYSPHLDHHVPARTRTITITAGNGAELHSSSIVLAARTADTVLARIIGVVLAVTTTDGSSCQTTGEAIVEDRNWHEGQHSGQLIRPVGSSLSLSVAGCRLGYCDDCVQSLEVSGVGLSTFCCHSHPRPRVLTHEFLSCCGQPSLLEDCELFTEGRVTHLHHIPDHRELDLICYNQHRKDGEADRLVDDRVQIVPGVPLPVVSGHG